MYVLSFRHSDPYRKTNAAHVRRGDHNASVYQQLLRTGIRQTRERIAHFHRSACRNDLYSRTRETQVRCDCPFDRKFHILNICRRQIVDAETEVVLEGPTNPQIFQVEVSRANRPIVAGTENHILRAGTIRNEPRTGGGAHHQVQLNLPQIPWIRRRLARLRFEVKWGEDQFNSFFLSSLSQPD